ncbi:MAG TPA: flagellar FlbD family protein [Anaeromyxobacteraceae bacterium]|nr:flagellar FlbD family protein [Anaeromyxobacteraceae bacterium]
MIALTRLDGKEVVINADHILTVEATPDTVITLTPGLHLMVKEPVEEVVARVAEWRRRVATGPARLGGVVPFPRSVPDPEREN